MDQPLTRRERIARERAAAQQAASSSQGAAEDLPENYLANARLDESANAYIHADTQPVTMPLDQVGERPYVRPAARDVRSGSGPEHYGSAPQHYGSAPQHYGSAPQHYAAPPSIPGDPYAEEYGQPVATGASLANREANNTKTNKPEPEPQPLGFVRGTIRGFGELCITAGLVLILFVVWQLWWTDIAANKDNENIAGQLSQNWRDNPLDKLPEDPGTPTPAATPDENQAFGIMYVPRFGDKYYRTIAEGVSLEPVLNRMGMGHYPSTARPGEVGNFAMAGHRVTYGKPLNLIAELQPGDRIYIQTREGVYTYTFRNYDIVLPDATDVLAAVPAAPDYKGKDRIMTLTACNPMFSARERYVAYATLTGWAPAGTDVPKELADSAAFKKAGEM